MGSSKQQKILVGTAVTGLSLLLPAAPSLSAEYTGVVSHIQPSHESLDCIFFRVTGVSTITPPSPGNWFAISRSSFGAMEAFAVLLASRTKNINVTVTTAADHIACGYTEATSVALL